PTAQSEYEKHAPDSQPHSCQDRQWLKQKPDFLYAGKCASRTIPPAPMEMIGPRISRPRNINRRLRSRGHMRYETIIAVTEFDTFARWNYENIWFAYSLTGMVVFLRLLTYCDGAGDIFALHLAAVSYGTALPNQGRA